MEKKYDQGILKIMGIREDIMPDMYPCEKIVGELTKEGAKATGLVSGIPVCAGQIDCNTGSKFHLVIQYGERNRQNLNLTSQNLILSTVSLHSKVFLNHSIKNYSDYSITSIHSVCRCQLFNPQIFIQHRYKQDYLHRC